MFKKSMFFLIFILLFGALWAQEDAFDEESLFGEDMIEEAESGSSDDGLFDEDMVSTLDDSSMAVGLDSMLLESGGVEIGGRFSFSLGQSISWSDQDLNTQFILDNISQADVYALSTTLGASLFFDARPDDSFRVFGKADLSYPFTVEGDWGMDDILHVRELFADFDWNDMLFFRVGKQTVKWGVGYFFSPADVLSLVSIDPENPEAEREGPLAAKFHMPVGVHNLYLYLITDQADNWEEISLAPKMEFVLGSMELGLGAFIRRDVAPMGMATITTALGDVQLFGEGVVSYGANKKFIEEADVSLEHPFGLAVVEKEDQLFFSATLGGSYFLNQVDSDWENISLMAQYLFNGLGYAEDSVFENPALFALLNNGDIAITDLMQRGRHYMAARIGWSDIFDSPVSLSLFWQSNLKDVSGIFVPSIQWSVVDYINLGVNASFSYGDEFGELNQGTKRAQFGLSLSLGTGSF